MPSPFPGMDPYLEDGNIWPGFHHYLADDLVAQLNAQVGPKYYADVNVRTVFREEGVVVTAGRVQYPDVGVVERRLREPGVAPAAAPGVVPAPLRRTVLLPDQVKLRSVEVRLTEANVLVTSIEILSPYNKRLGEGLEEYREKRLRLLRSPVHLIEIDLLRGGQRPGREVNEPPVEAEYILLVNRSRDGDGRISEIWPVALDEALPVLPVPLLAPDPDVALDLNGAIRAVYARAAYDRRLDYRQPAPPPELRPEIAAWLAQHLAETE